MPRFLHTADWQLGRQYARFEQDDGMALAEARFTAVETLAALAAEERVDAVLVAGDIFDAQTLSERTLHRTFQALSAYSGPWLMLPGNHDAALAESVWTRAARIGAIPPNVHLLAAAEPFMLANISTAILPAPLTQRQTYQDLTAWFDHAETPEGFLRIGLAHGSVTGQLAESVDSPNPIAADRAASARLDYLALGDWHGCKQIDAHIWYSGTPEADRFRNNASGQALLVSLEAPGEAPSVRPVEVGRHGWHQWRRQLAVASDVDELIAELDALPARSVLDLTLQGQLDLASYQRLEQALGLAAGRQRSLQIHQSELTLAPTNDDIAALQADGYVGKVIEDLQQRQQSNAESEMANEALAILAGLLLDQTPASHTQEHPSCS
ncbi:MAG: DNA repair exonuclease [Halomonas sp.]